MTRRTAKRPAVRVRWEFSDTPYKRPGERLSLRAMLPLAKELFGSMTPKALFRFAKIMAKGEPGLDKRFDREKRPCLFVGQQSRPPAANQPGIRNADAGLALIFPYSRAYNGSSPRSRDP